MMNWNQNDTKYIFKRLILYFIIAGIVFFAGHSCAKAQVVSSYMTSNYLEIQNGSNNETLFMNTSSQIFNGAGQGFVNFTLVQLSDLPAYPLKAIEVEVGPINSTSISEIYNCNYGTFSAYRDSTEQYIVYNVECAVSIPSGKRFYGINVKRVGSQNKTYLYFNDLITFTSEQSEANAISSAINTASAQQITQQTNDINQNTRNSAQAIIDQIGTTTQQEITAINNQTTAINNQTTAINNQTQWFDQDYSSVIDTEFLDVFDDLFDNDDDVVRQFILIPLNFFVLIYNACSSNSCSPIVLGELYGTTLSIPCINWSSLLGTAVTNTIDIIFAGCLVFGMVRMIKKMINKIMTLSSTITDECGVEVFK